MKIKNRIKSNIEFAKCVKAGKTLKSREFTIHYLKNELGYIRIGVSVSTKLGKAVVRNRIKRQIREMVKECLNFEISYDVVVIARNNYLENDFYSNLQILNQMIKKTEDLK